LQFSLHAEGVVGVPLIRVDGRSGKYAARPGRRPWFVQSTPPSERFLADPDVSEGTGFGTTPGLRVGTEICAMIGRVGELVVKLPKGRVHRLVASASAHDSTRGETDA
jgi:hypothetical protein